MNPSGCNHWEQALKFFDLARRGGQAVMLNLRKAVIEAYGAVVELTLPLAPSEPGPAAQIALEVLFSLDSHGEQEAVRAVRRAFEEFANLVPEPGYLPPPK